MSRRPRDRARSQTKSLGLEQHKSSANKNYLSIRGRRTSLAIVLTGITGLLLIALIKWLASDSLALLKNQAEAAAHAGDWNTAQQNWRTINTSTTAKSSSLLGEAQACLALARAAEAEYALRRAIRTNPSDSESWHLLLEILLIEDRTLEAQRLGWEAYDQISPDARPEVLRTLTLALLADLPDEQVRKTLRRWIDADPDDVNAQIAFWQRIVLQPRAADPDRPSTLAALEALLTKYPAHVGVREVLITALADAGEPDRGRVVLDTWPDAARRPLLAPSRSVGPGIRPPS